MLHEGHNGYGSREKDPFYIKIHDVEQALGGLFLEFRTSGTVGVANALELCAELNQFSYLYQARYTPDEQDPLTHILWANYLKNTSTDFELARPIIQAVQGVEKLHERVIDEGTFPFFIPFVYMGIQMQYAYLRSCDRARQADIATTYALIAESVFLSDELNFGFIKSAEFFAWRGVYLMQMKSPSAATELYTAHIATKRPQAWKTVYSGELHGIPKSIAEAAIKHFSAVDEPPTV